MTGSSPAPTAARPEPRAKRKRSFPWSDVATTAAAFLLAFIVGALLMIFSDTEVRSKFAYFFARPLMRSAPHGKRSAARTAP